MVWARLTILKRVDEDAPLNTPYLLIDYENVQPKSLSVIEGQPLKVFVFAGARQKVDVELANAMMALQGRFVHICGNGRNALDFHIAFTMGDLSAKDPSSSFYLVSKDSGFDPLLGYIRKRGATAVRLNSLDELPTAMALQDKLEIIVCNLDSRGDARPRRLKALANTIKTLFPPDIPDHEVESLIAALARDGHISIADGALSYR